MSAAAELAIGWVEQGFVPDSVIRRGIRRMLARRLEDIGAGDAGRSIRQLARVHAQMSGSPLALVPDIANAQHYEVPASFFTHVLGPRCKYSACLWQSGAEGLDAAERAALEATCVYADLQDGQDVLELGCGWGSLSIWMAERYPKSRITAVSNSCSQREFILGRARKRKLTNLTVITADMNDFAPPGRFDRVVSVEMFEHMRNWRELFARVHDWLTPGGRFYLHVFVHRSTPYFFEDQGPADWMGRHFFSGGLMPSDDLPLRFQGPLFLERQWRWDGRHYQRTLNAWLDNLDARREQVMPAMVEVYGAQDAELWLQRWRIFFMACAELFGYDAGQQWWVSHYLFQRPVAEG